MSGTGAERASLDGWWHVLPRGLTSDARRLLVGKAVRAFSDGLVSVVLPLYLLQVGFSAFEVGAIITSTVFGSALLTLVVAFMAHRVSGRTILVAACLLMAGTG